MVRTFRLPGPAVSIRAHELFRQRPQRELILLAGLFAAGFLILPAVTWLLGAALLGSQPGGLGSVYGAVFGEALLGKPAAWLFAASPYLVVQSVRLMLWPFRDRPG